MSIKNKNGYIYADSSDVDIELELDFGWGSEEVTLSLSTEGGLTLSIDLTRDELKLLKNEVKTLLKEWDN